MALIAVDKFEPAVEGNKVLNAEYIDWGEEGAPGGASAYIGTVDTAWTITTSAFNYSGTIKNGTIFILTFASNVGSSTQKLYLYNSSTSQNDGYNMKYQSSSAAGALNGKIYSGETVIFAFDGTDFKYLAKDTAKGILPTASSSVLGGIKIGFTATQNKIPLQLSSNKAYVDLPQASITGNGVVMLSDSENIVVDIIQNNDTKAITPKAYASSIDSRMSLALESKIKIVEEANYPQSPTVGALYFIYDT